MSRLASRIINSALWSAVETWGRQISLFLIFVLLARHLGPHALGLAALATVAPTILAVPATQGLPEALIQRPQLDERHFDSVFWLLVATGLVLSAGIYFSAGLIAHAFGEPLLMDLIPWTSAIVAIQAVSSVPTAVLKRKFNFRLLAIRTLAGTLAGGAVGVGMAVAGFGVWSLIGMQLAKVSLEACVLLVFGDWRPRLRMSYAPCRELFGFATPVLVQSLWTFVNEELPKVILGASFGSYAVGVYTFARRPLDLLVQGLVSPLTNITLPAISRIQQQPEQVDQFFDTGVRVAGLIGFPAFIGFAAIAPEAIPLVFGDQWTNAVLPVQLFMIIGLLRTVDSLCGLTILALGYSKMILSLNIAYTVLILIALPIGVQISLEAAIAAQVFCNFVLVPIFLALGHSVAGVNVLRPLTLFPRLAIASGIVYAAVTAWRLSVPDGTHAGVVLGVGIVVGAVAYALAAVLLMRTDLLRTRDTLLGMRG